MESTAGDICLIAAADVTYTISRYNLGLAALNVHLQKDGLLGLRRGNVHRDDLANQIGRINLRYGLLLLHIHRFLLGVHILLVGCMAREDLNRSVSVHGATVGLLNRLARPIRSLYEHALRVGLL